MFDHQCIDPIEKLYYSCNFEDICVHCGQKDNLWVSVLTTVSRVSGSRQSEKTSKKEPMCVFYIYILDVTIML